MTKADIAKWQTIEAKACAALMLTPDQLNELCAKITPLTKEWRRMDKVAEAAFAVHRASYGRPGTPEQQALAGNYTYEQAVAERNTLRAQMDAMVSGAEHDEKRRQRNKWWAFVGWRGGDHWFETLTDRWLAGCENRVLMPEDAATELLRRRRAAA